MTFLIMVASLLVGWLGQKLKSKPEVPNEVVLLTLSLVGLAFYGIGHGFPIWDREAVLAWLDEGWVWSLALPGAASYFGLIPGMETKR